MIYWQCIWFQLGKKSSHEKENLIRKYYFIWQEKHTFGKSWNFSWPKFSEIDLRYFFPTLELLGHGSSWKRRLNASNTKPLYMHFLFWSKHIWIGELEKDIISWELSHWSIDLERQTWTMPVAIFPGKTDLKEVSGWNFAGLMSTSVFSNADVAYTVYYCIWCLMITFQNYILINI